MNEMMTSQQKIRKFRNLKYPLMFSKEFIQCRKWCHFTKTTDSLTDQMKQTNKTERIINHLQLMWCDLNLFFLTSKHFFWEPQFHNFATCPLANIRSEWPSCLKHRLTDHSASHCLGRILSGTNPILKKFAGSLVKVGVFLSALWFPTPFQNWPPWYLSENLDLGVKQH